MKKRILKTLILTSLLTFSITTFQGCQNTPVQTAISAEGVVITSVNTGMAIWKSYVDAGKATQLQVDTIKSAYNTYFNAQQVVKATLELSLTSTNATTNDLATASASVTSAETSLLQILNQYILNK